MAKTSRPKTGWNPQSKSSRALQKCGAVASFLLAVSFLVAGSIYLTGNLDEPSGPFTYALADLFHGPVWAASLVTVVLGLRERMGDAAPRRMSIALLAAVIAAAAMVAVASIRANNRQYILHHPELFMESPMIAWTTLVAGVSGAGFHFLGWALALIGWSGWTSARIPRVLSALYLLAGAVAMSVYALPANEGGAALLLIVVSIWQGVLLWSRQPREEKTREKTQVQIR